MPLIDVLEVQKVLWVGYGCGRTLMITKYCGHVFGTGEDGPLPYVKTVYHAVMLDQTSRELQVQVCYAPPGVLEER